MIQSSSSAARRYLRPRADVAVSPGVLLYAAAFIIGLLSLVSQQLWLPFPETFPTIFLLIVPVAVGAMCGFIEPRGAVVLSLALGMAALFAFRAPSICLAFLGGCLIVFAVIRIPRLLLRVNRNKAYRRVEPPRPEEFDHYLAWTEGQQIGFIASPTLAQCQQVCAGLSKKSALMTVVNCGHRIDIFRGPGGRRGIITTKDQNQPYQKTAFAARGRRQRKTYFWLEGLKATLPLRHLVTKADAAGALSSFFQGLAFDPNLEWERCFDNNDQGLRLVFADLHRESLDHNHFNYLDHRASTAPPRRGIGV